MKKLIVPVVCLVMSLMTPSAGAWGWFQVCVSQGDGGNFPDTCAEDPESGNCIGACTQYVITNQRACASTVNPISWCGGTSYAIMSTYAGSCSDDDCGCILDCTSGPEEYIPNECS